jgi:formate dehydrogenase subunit delta
MSIEHLTQMANDIGSFFHAEPRREDAIAGIATHIKRFWTPRMRQQIAEHLQAGGEGLDELPRAAVQQLLTESAARPAA